MKSKDYISNIKNDFPEASYTDILKQKNDLFNCSVYDQGLNEFEHFHDHIELLYVIKATATVYINKQECILSNGDFLVIIPGDVHNIICPETCRIISIEADTNFLFSHILTNTDLHYTMPYMLSKFDQARLFKADMIDSTDIPKTIYNIVNENSLKKDFYKLAVRADLTKIALYVFRRWNSLKETSNEFDNTNSSNGIQRLSKVLKELDEHYMEDISVAQMAQIAGMSYSFFSRFFKSTMKHTFSDYLNSIRIREAEKLLLESDLSIAEIGEAVGFSNTSYFISQFKKQLHITPKKYKSNYGKQ